MKKPKRKRNLAIAAQSRSKIFAAEQNLKIKEQNMREQYELLVKQERELRNQVYLLKNEVLKHADCSAAIHAYICSSAEKIANNAVGGRRESRILASTDRV